MVPEWQLAVETNDDSEPTTVCLPVPGRCDVTVRHHGRAHASLALRCAALRCADASRERWIYVLNVESIELALHSIL